MTINSGDAAASVGNFLRQWHTVMEDKTHDRDLIKYSRCYVPWNTDFSTMVLPLLERSMDEITDLISKGGRLFGG